MAPESLRKLVQQALELSDAKRTNALNKAMRRFASRVSAEDAEWLLDLRRHGGAFGISDEQWQQFIERWATAEPEKAAAFLEAHGLLAGADAASLFKAWVRGDASSVLAWVDAGDDHRKEWWDNHHAAYGTAWAAHDLDGALAWLEREGGNSLDVSIIEALHQQRGIPGLEAWLSAHGENATSSARVAASATLLRDSLKTGGLEAALAYLDTRPQIDEQISGIGILGTPFIAAAPEKALTWIERLASQAEFLRSAAEIAMSQWARTDPGAAGDWLAAHRTSPAFREYVWAYAMSLAVENPDAAKKWAALLPPDAGPGGQSLPGKTSQTGAVVAGGNPALGVGTLQQHIEAVAGLLAAWNRRNPAAETSSSPVIARTAFLRPYNPVLVREFPGAEPSIRMVARGTFT